NRVQHVRQGEIGNELSAAGQQEMILAARDRAADEGRFFGIVHSRRVISGVTRYRLASRRCLRASFLLVPLPPSENPVSHTPGGCAPPSRPFRFRPPPPRRGPWPCRASSPRRGRRRLNRSSARPSPRPWRQAVRPWTSLPRGSSSRASR